MMADIIDVTTKEEFDKLVSLNNQLIVIHFMADWAQQCNQINDVLKELAKLNEYSSVKFAKLSAESLPNISEEYGITSVPTCVLLSNKKEIHRIEGIDIPLLTKRVKQEAFKLNPLSNNSSSLTKSNNINDRLKVLVNKSPVMIFMKGSPDAPRCGFSRTLVGILNDANVKYETFDILQDEEVRQELKTFSNWPTYPQVYAKGELIGGLDIIKEMKESGELEEALSA